MEISALQKARYEYAPKLPGMLRHGIADICVKEGEETQSVADQEKIKALFPNTYGKKEITFEKGQNTSDMKKQIVGVILSGGQAPGGHNVITGLYDALKATNPDNVLYGFKGGPDGLLKNDYVVFDDAFIDAYRNTGGFDIIGVILQKYFKVPVSIVMNICDITVILIQVASNPFMKNVYGILAIMICTITVNKVLAYGQSQCEIMIMSHEYEKIRERIYKEIDVGLTLLKAETGYLREDMQVILVVTQYKKIATIKKISVEIDPTSFVFVSDVHSVIGKGYTLSR